MRDHLPRVRTTMLFLLVLQGVLASAPAWAQADGDTIFGPRMYARVPGPVLVIEDTFLVENPIAPVYLRVTNGEPNGTSRLTDVTIDINGLRVLSPDDFGDNVPQAIALITEALLGDPAAENAMVISLADDFSGFIIVEVATTFDDSAPPPPPILGGYPPITTLAEVLVSGLAQSAAMVEVAGPGAPPFEVPVNNGLFSVQVPLAANRLNSVAFTSISAAGARSAPTTASITNDQTAPVVHIDFPTDGIELTTATTDVAGRVGDTLSGFSGLTVTVNGIEAIVDVGIGTNGTFFAADVPLDLGQPTPLVAVARDMLGNESTADISVTRVEIPPDTAQMSIVGGNGQAGAVREVLAGPLEVLVRDQLGDPLPDKIVTFDVTRSDGRVGAAPEDEGAMMVQVRADGAGIARAYWRLGSDAGCGNNRVTVRSRSIAGSVFFCASAVSGPATGVRVGSGNNQRGEAGAPAMAPLVAWVTDGTNGVADVPVTFTVVRGNGTVGGMEQTTIVSDQTGHAQVFLNLGSAPGNNVVEAAIPQSVGMPARFVAFGIARQGDRDASFLGLVLDNASQPIDGAVCHLTIGATEVEPTSTDAEGRFAFNDIPSGMAHLVVDASTAGDFPSLAFETLIVPNAENSLPTPIVIPPLMAENQKAYSTTVPTELTVVGIDGLVMTVEPGSMFLDGQPAPNGTPIALNQVHFDNIPMPMPDGAAPPFAWTLQPAGAHFDPPIKVQLPNMVGLPPGAAMFFLSFDHDTNRFEIVATGSTTEDGSCFVSDPGSGITKAGWGGFCPPYPDSGDVAGEGDDEGDDGSMEDEEDPKDAQGEEGVEEPKCEEGGPGEVADPVYLFSGEFYENVEDLRIKGRGTDFVWSRKYRSKIGPTTAQGNAWDFSYNIRLQEDGENLVLRNGSTRRDLYQLQEDGSYTRRGFFRELVKNPDGTLTLNFASQGKWHFNALDGVHPGRIRASEDRNGNTITFTYGALSRLVTVTDTLDRDIDVAYTPEGFVDSITDFTGRQVRYEYYQDGDSGGSSGDLKSVTTPAVVGTPNGNDFPNGKTTVYTYSTGHANPALNHNLLTITDPKGQTYLTNIYDTTTDPLDVDFDRLERQIWGNAGDIIDFQYIPLQNGVSGLGYFIDARIQVIVNDRVGNVKEYFYDKRRRAALMREYTGRADPDQPTTDVANRPMNQLRSDDPVLFETRWEYNEESLLSRTVFPNNNVVVNLYDSDLDEDCPQRRKGNLRFRIQKPRAADLPPGPPVLTPPDQVSITEEFEYDPDFGGCCGFNFVTRHTDGRGNVTIHEYDDRGNRTRTHERIASIVEEWEFNEFGQATAHILPDNGSAHRRRDEFVYFDAGPHRGYLHEAIIDAPGLTLTTTYEYDLVGNKVRIIDPRGRDTQFVVNERDQIVRETSREVAAGIRYERDVFYDANDNVVRRDAQNVDADGVVQPNTHFSSIYDYEILNYVVGIAEEAGNAQLTGDVLSIEDIPAESADAFIVMEYAYDAKRNRTLVRYGEATNGNQPTNTVDTKYDERDLVYQFVRAETDLNQSTTQYDYDRNANHKRTLVGLEDTPREHLFLFDGYDRRTVTIDPMGNRTSVNYDPNDNLIRRAVHGELIDVEGDVDNVRLSEIAYEFDDVDRLVLRREAFFETATQAPIGDGASESRLDWNDRSQLLRTIDDNGHAMTLTYDTADRRATLVDDKGNVRTYSYDANSNLLEVHELDRSDSGQQDESFTTLFTYDGVDRPVAKTDNVGNVSRESFDSRNNPTRFVDPLDNVVRREFDGVNRQLVSTRVLTDDGTGQGTPIGVIATQQEWDDSSRLRAYVDENGNATRWVFDALDRDVERQHADGTVHRYVFDVHDNLASRLDANQSLTTCIYDLLNRVARKDVVHGPGVDDDTTFEAFTYDGLSRLAVATDDDSVVRLEYNSRSDPIREELNGQATASVYDGEGNRVACTYPSGRVVSCIYDELDRIVAITDQIGEIADYGYVGAGRREVVGLGNGTRASFAYDGATGVPNLPGDFGVKRVVRTLHEIDGTGEVIDDRRYTWDPVQNKKSRSNEQRPARGRAFTYDSIYRLVESQQASGIIALESADLVQRRGQSVVYAYDGVANRNLVVGGSDPGAYTLDPTLPEPADLQVNQYTTTPMDARLYDENGNLIETAGSSTSLVVTYDYRNRMVRLRDDATGITTSYRYDALGRRIERAVEGQPVVRYFYSGWQVCEEQDAASNEVATYVYGAYIDEVVTMRRGGGDYYYHCDDLFNVVAATNSAGEVVERVEYDDFGRPAFFDADHGPLVMSQIGNPYLFNGRRFDEESGWYLYRTRYLDPRAGRFTSRDVIGAWADSRSIGNGYTYVAANPWRFVDPLGTTAVCPQAPPNQCLAEGDNFVPYDKGGGVGSMLFHCGLSGSECFLETIDPMPNNPQQECCYDGGGGLIGPGHPYAGCAGSANQYDDAWDHTFNDSGGIWNQGWDGFTDSMGNVADDVGNTISEWWEAAEQGVSDFAQGVSDFLIPPAY